MEILLFDPDGDENSFIGKELSRCDCVVNIVTTGKDLQTRLESIGPDIILLSAGDEFDISGDMLDIISMARERGIPFTIICSVSEVDFYFNALKNGIYNTISIPLSRDYLAQSINDIVKGDSVSLSDNGPVSLEFVYKDKEYSLAIDKIQLLQFIISTLKNHIHYNRVLTDIAERKQVLNDHYSSQKTSQVKSFHSDDVIAMEKEFIRALEKDEFMLYYQPVIFLENDSIAGFESLIRWQHPTKGIVSPGYFIDIAEYSPLIIAIGFRVIEEATRQLKSWHEKYRMNPPMKMSINLSASQFVFPSFSDRIKSIIVENRVDPSQIVFEITERAFMQDMESANIQLLKLRAENHQLYMDDFGTGYSSLSYLQHFPVDVLKIDMSFVQWMHIDEQSEEIVRSIVALAHNLKMKVVAEGVEEAIHVRMLKDIGCDFAQGFYFSRPLCSGDAEKYIKRYMK